MLNTEALESIALNNELESFYFHKKLGVKYVWSVNIKTCKK